MATVLVDRKTTLRVERQPVRARLAVLGNVRRVVTALVDETRRARRSLCSVDRVAIGIAEEQVIVRTHPHRSFGEVEPFRQLEELGVRRNDRIDRGVRALDLDVHFVRRHRNRSRGDLARTAGTRCV